MVRMLVCTCYNGKQYKPGDECSVGQATENRWIKNNIAENATSFDAVDFDAMTDEQLEEYAESKGVDISRCRSRETAIAKIVKAERDLTD